MKCLYCHENVQPEGDVCPKCGLPLIEDTTLLELSGPAKPSATDWLQQHKPLLLAAGGGFAAALVIGIIVISSMNAGGAEPAMVVNPASARPLEPVQMASRAPVPSYGAGGPSFPSRPDAAPPVQAGVTPAAPLPAAAPAPVSRTVSPEPEVSYEPPPQLPDDFEYDPQWGFPAPPKEPAPRRRPDPVLEPTPPSHTLTMDPSRPRSAQYVTVIRNRGVEGVTTVSGSEPVGLSALEGD